MLVGTDLLALWQESGNMGATVTLSDSAAIIAFSDLDHDGETEHVVVRTLASDMLYELAVEEQDGTKIWTTEASPAHTGWNTIMLYNEGGQDYLVPYLPAMFQGVGSYTCTVFSLEGGKQTMKEEWSVEFELPVEETPEMTQFAQEVGILLRKSMVLLSTEYGILVDRPAEASALPQLYPVRFNPDEIQSAVDGWEIDEALTSNAVSFPDAPVELLFASGAGAWGTVLTLQPDGSFTGSYSDAEMGVNAPEYPDGTYYVCTFDSRFTDIQQISDYAWSMKLVSLTTEKPEGQTWIEDKIRYIASAPYGLADGKDFILYAPGTPADELPAECRDWWPDAYLWRNGELDQLTGWGLCNVSTGYGFYQRTIAEESVPVIPLTIEEIARVNEAFDPFVYDKRGNPIAPNSRSCFLTSYYDDVRDMDFEEFLRYFPGDGSQTSTAEFEALKSIDVWPFDWVETRADMPVPIHKYPSRLINLVLNEYAGITLADLDTSAVAYLPEYDAYYNYTSDFGLGGFICTRGEIEDNIVRLYQELDSGSDLLTLQKEGNTYRIVSHQRLAGGT